MKIRLMRSATLVVSLAGRSREISSFYRAEAARTCEGGGTGLGPSIARDPTEAQGGKLTVESAEGEGARFYLELPRS